MSPFSFGAGTPHDQAGESERCRGACAPQARQATRRHRLGLDRVRTGLAAPAILRSHATRAAIPTANNLHARVRQDAFEDPVQEAFVSLLVTAGHLRQALDEACQPHGITHDQYNVLRILRGAHPGGHPRREIADRMIERSPDVTRFIGRLERDGLVERYKSDEDRRLSMTRVTAKGLAVLAAADDGVRAVREKHLGGLSAGDLEVLRRVCLAVYESV